MAASKAAEFFQVFLNGKNCEEIHRLNPNGFSLGAIVRARLEGDWDELRREHQELLMVRVRERVQQVTLETVERVANEMSASNKLVNDKIMRYLQTGDEHELAGLAIGSVKHLKDMVELLQELTGANKEKKVVTTTVTVNGSASQATTTNALPVVPAGKPLPAQTAAAALEAIHKNRQKN